jgi:hypothetical protein
MTRAASLVAVIAGAGVISALAWSGGDDRTALPHSPRVGHASHAQLVDEEVVIPPVPTTADDDYGRRYRTSLKRAVASARLGVLVPTAASANADNLRAVYLSPNRNLVALTYRVPRSERQASKGLDQTYLGIAESSWALGDWSQFIEGYLQHTNLQGVAECSVADRPALCSTARAATSAGQSNAAYLMLEVDGTRVELSGGASLDVLKAIASSLVPASSDR